MIQYSKTDASGRCYGKTPFGCDVMEEEHEKCGTFACPFYKPDGCQDWVRLDRGDVICLFSPDETERVRP